MKYLREQGWLAIALLTGTCLSPQARALKGPHELVHNLSRDFFMRSSRGYLGVDLKNVSASRAAELKLAKPHGAEILAVDHDAPAAKAGLRVHDVLVEMNGQPIDSCDQMRHKLKSMLPGNSVTFVVSRSGESLNITVQLADRAKIEQQAWSRHFSVPEPEPSSAPIAGESFVARGSMSGGTPSIGAELNPVSAQLAEYFGVVSGTGLLVENVASQTPASEAGLQAGDVILRVNTVAMITNDDWRKAIEENPGKPVRMTVLRHRREHTLTLVPKRPE